MNDYIVIPARFYSKRLPGKPLRLINGVPLINRVISIALQVSKQVRSIEVIVTTDDQMIVEHCAMIGVKCVLTSKEITSGSERVYEACKIIGVKPNFIINLQGDAPFISVENVISIINKAREVNAGVMTPIIRLSWSKLDNLRLQKTVTPFSGTTCTIDNKGKALWFSKNIIPSIRLESDLRCKYDFSPVYQHLGLYCYSYENLEWFLNSPVGYYEGIEELEQLRFIENGIVVHTEIVQPSIISMSGIDSLEDIEIAERKIIEFGDPHISW
jgi:3-deoxy-manno-octulosonate cytidylyltransferase (CMP-KDO synthetase)